MTGKQKRLRVRSKRLAQLDEAKLSLALWLLTGELLSDTPAAEAPSLTEVTDPATDELPEAA